MIYISNSPAQTEAVAERLAARLQPGTVLAYRGDLGAGKTAFTRGLARGLGYEEPVTSPTYTIVQEYPLPGSGRLYHMDLYRINSAESALAFGVDEFLDDPDGYALLEWPERIGGIIPDGAKIVRLRHLDDGGREISICE